MALVKNSTLLLRAADYVIIFYVHLKDLLIMTFIIKLYQIENLKALSLLGYIFGILYLFICGPAISEHSYNNHASAGWVGISLYKLIYVPVAIISFFARIVEYNRKSKNNLFKINKLSIFKYTLFVIGLILFFIPTILLFIIFFSQV